jgi:hypothetical protein
MKFKRNDVKTLSHAKELELFDDARPPKLNKHSARELRDLVKRSRTLRDKLRDVKKGQIRSMHTKTKARGGAPADRSKEKAEMFAEIHDVFVARLEKVETGEAKAAAVKTPAKPTKTDKNLQTRAERTATKQNLGKVRKQANAPEAKPKGKAKGAAEAKTSAKPGKVARPKKLASAVGPPRKRLKLSGEVIDPAQSPTGMGPASPQSAGRRTPAKAKVEKDRISRSGIKQKRSHLSSVNKRNQAKRDSK